MGWSSVERNRHNLARGPGEWFGKTQPQAAVEVRTLGADGLRAQTDVGPGRMAIQAQLLDA